MSVVINTNYSATVAANNLATSTNSLQKSLNRLSSGSKIVSPADDAGGLAVSMKLSAAAVRQGAVANNLGNATSYLQTQDGALKVAGKILDRMGELKTLNDDATKNTDDKLNYNTEFEALQEQLSAITNEEFNGISLFGSGNASGEGLFVYTTEAGSAAGAASVEIKPRNLASTSSTGVGSLIAAADLSTVNLSVITDSIQAVATFRAENGAEQSRLGFAAELLTVNKANLESAASRITDVDVAHESTQLARWNVLVQAGTSMLTQANTSAQTALKLLQ